MLGRRTWRSVPLRRRGHEGKPFRYPLLLVWELALTARIVHKARVGAEKSIAIFHSLFPSFQFGILSRLLLLNGTIPPTVLIVHRWPCHSAAAAVMLSVCNVVYLPREKKRKKQSHTQNSSIGTTTSVSRTPSVVALIQVSL